MVYLAATVAIIHVAPTTCGSGAESIALYLLVLQHQNPVISYRYMFFPCNMKTKLITLCDFT